MVTLEDIKQKQSEIDALIASYEAVAKVKGTFPLTVEYPELKPGERRIGTIIDAEGKGYHLVLMPGQAEGKTWAAAMEWAKDTGGDLPNRVESAMLFAYVKDEFKPEWHWLNEQRSGNSDYAWVQYFNGGNLYYFHKSNEYRCRAVRRLAI